ncbi:MAG: DR2241 family protein [Haloglomus sp.]
MSAPDTASEERLTVSDEAIASLAAAAEAGVDFDGLRAAREDDTEEASYRFETPEVTRAGLTESEFRDACTNHPRYVDNWWFFEGTERSPADRDFLRWLESGGAEDWDVGTRYDALREGITRSWGEVAVTAMLGAGGRRYELRHEEDAGTPLPELERHGDPLDARELVKYDDRGRYRPLKTAPTLPTGWAFVGLDGRDCTRALDLIYPATVANWHLEREDELDVDHWREAMERQTGIYGVVETWDRGEGYEHVNWVAEACCDDSQCLKRREWQYDDETDLDVDGGDGVFPCREPCSLVVSAARKWTRLEGEQPRTYEFELTPSEKEQVEAIVDAVADGRVDEIREADLSDGANRYRARFLRAKRFDDEGHLCGVETDPDGEQTPDEEH